MNYLEQSEEIIVKLLHYFITDKNYNPVILHGAKNEIWLENLDNEYKIIRIVSNYIHNDEQLEYDVLRTKQIMKSIKKKTLSLKIPTLSIFVNLGENVHLDKEKNVDNITCLKATNLDDLVKNNTILECFPDINKTLDYKEEGMNLFLKLTSEINKKTEKDAKEAEKIFGPKKPIVTYTLIFINILVFMAMYLFGNGSEDSLTLLTFGANYRPLILEFNQYYRLITSSFLHIGILHLLFNMYALYIIGAQIENFYGKAKYLIIYLGSAIFGSLLSICFPGAVYVRYKIAGKFRKNHNLRLSLKSFVLARAEYVYIAFARHVPVAARCCLCQILRKLLCSRILYKMQTDILLLVQIFRFALLRYGNPVTALKARTRTHWKHRLYIHLCKYCIDIPDLTKATAPAPFSLILSGTGRTLLSAKRRDIP